MDLWAFFLSWPGTFATQSFLHSFVAAVVAEMAVRAWGITRPSVRQRFFVGAILFPAFSVPLYELAGRPRNSLEFRIDALLDSGRWLAVELPGRVPLGAVLILVFAATAAVFLVQELVPVARHAFARGNDSTPPLRSGGDPRVDEALASLGVPAPRVCVIEDEEPIIFSSTGRVPAVYLSTGLLAALGQDELRAALAHEIAHVLRARRPLLAAVFFLRIVLFFNPVVLVEFRRAVQEDEKICDEMAVSLTGDAPALARTLRTLYLGAEEPSSSGGRRSPAAAAAALERYSHRLNILSRISRLGEEYPPPAREAWLAFGAAAAATAALCWFVV